MRVISRITKGLYSASLGVLSGLGLYLLLLVVISVLSGGSVHMVITAPGGFLAEASLDSLTTGVNGMIFVVVFLVFVIGSAITFTLFLLRWGKKLAHRMKHHENTKLAKVTTEEAR